MGNSRREFGVRPRITMTMHLVLPFEVFLQPRRNHLRGARVPRVVPSFTANDSVPASRSFLLLSRVPRVASLVNRTSDNGADHSRLERAPRDPSAREVDGSDHDYDPHRRDRGVQQCFLADKRLVGSHRNRSHRHAVLAPVAAGLRYAGFHERSLSICDAPEVS
jgi:hypothetical protein